jgi:peptide/nickel transport system permease protein
MEAQVAIPVIEAEVETGAPEPRSRRLTSNPSVLVGGAVLAVVMLASLLAPWLGTVDPTLLDPANRDLPAGASGTVTLLDGATLAHTFWMGTDSYGRDIYSRVLFGGRVSLIVGVAVPCLSLAAGMVFGLVAGYFRRADGVLMRFMDGLMAIPGILLAMALVALLRASIWSVVAAITIPEIPRVVRLVRSLVLSIREEPYVEAAISVGTSSLKVLYRHILPNTIAPLIVQGTYVCAAAILVEAILSFLGAGIPTEVPSWGNVMSEGRLQFNEQPHNIAFPGIFLTLTILAVNILGDGLRDTLDPRFARRGHRA